MQSDDIALMLPRIWQRHMAQGSVTQALVGVMAALHGSVEAAIDDPSALTDPRRAPDRLVPVLAGWVGLGRYLRPRAEGDDTAPHPGDLRELTAIAAALGRNRGTADSLIRFLTAATGVAGFTVREDPGMPFHFHLGIPRDADPRGALILRIVAAEKPAFATFETHILPPPPPAAPPAPHGDPQ